MKILASIILLFNSLEVPLASQAYGKLIFNGLLTDPHVWSLDIDSKSWLPGLYYVHLISTNSVSIKKIIKV